MLSCVYVCWCALFLLFRCFQTSNLICTKNYREISFCLFQICLRLSMGFYINRVHTIWFNRLDLAPLLSLHFIHSIYFLLLFNRSMFNAQSRTHRLINLLTDWTRIFTNIKIHKYLHCDKSNASLLYCLFPFILFVFSFVIF